MRKCKVANIILNKIIKDHPCNEYIRKEEGIKKCDGFLCTSEGLCMDNVIKATHITQLAKDYLIMAITNILLTVGNAQDISLILLSAIESTGSKWADCLDRRQVRICYNNLLYN